VAEEFSQRRGCQSVRRNRCQEGEHRDALAEVEVLRFVDEAGIPKFLYKRRHDHIEEAWRCRLGIR
jgi:hypothetical protein